MDLQKFAETYSKLEDKALDIMTIWGIGNYDLDGIEVEEHNNKLLFNIKTSIYYSGCGAESEWLTFDLEEMNNDIEYFKTKHKEKVEKIELDKKLAKEKETENRRLQKEAKDKADYKRLKLKFETES
jgi:chloramphenicol O-acetyltransferase